jgi:uncharacterized membrane protein (DUF106 family)
MGLIPILPMNVEIIVIIIAVAYTGISILAQRLLTNPKRMREIQYKVKVMQKDMNELMKNKASQEELMAKQKEFMPLMGEQMKNSLKPMMVILPLLLITYYLLLPNLPIGASNLNGSKELFFIIVFGLGICAAIVIMIYDRGKSKKERQEEAQVVADGDPSKYKEKQQ